ncbi:LysR substrate-binding domain-containing protein [Pseudomarimonas salicorniae]|uniref:LysR substrate-binding domain-containing protein n=1 Tax=Pseudomarimonas salicorniae TaxID=2933270 RepID=A0ABT0GJR9_9GAMM|nr:LysR substrate-binding domain-containing protein [Lysobacter sp. CAU 1642]MCK7594658.1 LysR substrate-binding domain-containing protein [Lysobacter sp. CAU 1642]
MNSLRAFEAAARTGSFVRAAEELHVTPGAVSHHVRELESALGMPLFDRRTRGVTVTAAGARYRARIGEALQLLEEATARLRRPELDGPLRLSLPQSTAQWWLAPRLPALLRDFPSLQLQVVADARRVDLLQGEADIALRFGPGDEPGLSSRLVMGDAVAVLASAQPPSRRGGGRGKASPPPLLEDLGAGEGETWLRWSPWLRELRLPRGAATQRVGFSDSGLALAACIAGAGWCLGRVSLAAEALRRGQLHPIASWRPTEYAHHLLCRPAESDSPRIAAFHDWLQQQARQFADQAEQQLGVRLALPE